MEGLRTELWKRLDGETEKSARVQGEKHLRNNSMHLIILKQFNVQNDCSHGLFNKRHEIVSWSHNTGVKLVTVAGSLFALLLKKILFNRLSYQ